MSGEFGFYNYVEDPNGWIDIFGLAKSYGTKKDGTPKKRPGPKTKDEGGPHNDVTGRIGKIFQDNDDWEIISGGNIKSEELVRTGRLKDRRPDVVARNKKTDRVVAVNVGKTNADGKTPIKREREAKSDLENVYGEGNVYFVGYN